MFVDCSFSITLHNGLFEKISVSASAATYGNFTYYLLYDGTVGISSGYTWDKQVTIPSTIDGKAVTYIDDNAFENCPYLETITIPNSVWYIGEEAFYNCPNLKSITIPDKVTYIGKYAFRRCSSLSSVKLSKNLGQVSDYMFNGCSALTSVTIPSGVTTIGIGAFLGCTELTSISIPDSVTNIENEAFVSCKSLKSIVLPYGIKRIGWHLFAGCSSLETVTIPNSVECIDVWAFGNCTSLISIRIPDSVTRIENSAFSGCSNLKSITIPDSVKNFGVDIFEKCYQLTIKCYEHSGAHSYAANNKIMYSLITSLDSNVTGLKMTSNAPTSISMSWNKVSGATGYVVYQAINGKWERIKVTSGNTLTVSNLKAGTNYRFTVKAYKTVSGKNYYSPSYTGVWMTTTPVKPAAKMTVNTPQAIRLEWGKVTGATGYVVYQQVNGSWVKKTVTKGNVYVATGLKSGTNYNFAVRAYRTFNGKNYYSPFATATDTIKTCTKPATVNFTLTAGTKKATVNWSKVTGATGYIVYYKTSANGSWQKLTTTTGTTYTKTGLTSGKTYYFAVKAYKTYNGKTYNASFTTKSVKVK